MLLDLRNLEPRKDDAPVDNREHELVIMRGPRACACEVAENWYEQISTKVEEHNTTDNLLPTLHLNVW
jgi:hypothetical protein